MVPVINLNCSVAAASNGAFDKLLSENGIAATTSPNNFNNYSRQSIARYQNFKAENGSLSPGGVQMPLGGTASLGSTGRQQQAAQQPAAQQPSPTYNQSPAYNQARREVAANSASRGSSSAPNSEPAASAAQSRGAAMKDNSLNNSLSGSNSYGANSNGQISNGTGAFGGGGQSAMADNTSNAYNKTQQAAMGNQSNYYQQGPAKSGSVSNLGGAWAPRCRRSPTRSTLVLHSWPDSSSRYARTAKPFLRPTCRPHLNRSCRKPDGVHPVEEVSAAIIIK